MQRNPFKGRSPVPAYKRRRIELARVALDAAAAEARRRSLLDGVNRAARALREDRSTPAAARSDEEQG